MGFLNSLASFFNPKPKIITPTLGQSKMPAKIANAAYAGRLMPLACDKIFLNQGELLHYVDKALYEKTTIDKRTLSRKHGYLLPTVWNDRGRWVNLNTETEHETVERHEYIEGALFITTQRVLFVGEKESFDEKMSSLRAVIPYANCIELQFDNSRKKVFVPDGGLAHQIIKLIKK